MTSLSNTAQKAAVAYLYQGRPIGSPYQLPLVPGNQDSRPSQQKIPLRKILKMETALPLSAARSAAI